MTMRTMRTAACVLAGLFAVQLTGCVAAAHADPEQPVTPGTVTPSGAAKVVADFLASQTGFHPYDVSCPSGQEAKVGVEFDCHFTGPEGPYTAHMRITKVEGTAVYYAVNTFRS